MARRRTRRKKTIPALLALVLALLSLALGEYKGLLPAGPGQADEPTARTGEEVSPGQRPSALPAADGTMTVHFIDVGQGDSLLAESDGHFLLVDAGENDQGDTVVSYLREAGVTSLDYVIGTHPHSDHIGGLDDVIRAFDVEAVILPPVAHTTKTFEDVLDAVQEKNLTLTQPVPGDSYDLGDAAFTILAPQADYGDDLNNWSVGIRLACSDGALVACGDAEAQAEEDIAASGLTLSADVLKVGHHGSCTSTSDVFLQAVSPAWAVISCGKENSYGHPHEETLKKLEDAGIAVLRTDLLGNITAQWGEDGITWTYEKMDSGS